MYNKIILEAHFQQWFYEKNSCRHWDSNPRPSDLHPLPKALPCLQGFASLQSMTLPLLVASTLGDLAVVTIATTSVTGIVT